MRYTLTKAMIAAAALSLPYLCAADPMQIAPLDSQAQDDCTNGAHGTPGCAFLVVMRL